MAASIWLYKARASGGGEAGEAMRRLRSMVTPILSRRSTPRMPSILPAHALPIGLRSIAGSFRSRRVCSPKVSSGRETSRALVAAVPLQDETRISFERPEANDLRFSVVVAAVSRRKRMSAPSMRTLTIGRTSQRSMGISEGNCGCCGKTGEQKTNKQKSKRAAFEAHRRSIPRWMLGVVGRYMVWPEKLACLIMARYDSGSGVFDDFVFADCRRCAGRTDAAKQAGGQRVFRVACGYRSTGLHGQAA